MSRNYAKLICDVSDLSNILSDHEDLRVFLKNIADMIASHMQSEVCSIYLYDDATQQLVLKATKGLHLAAIDHVKLGLGEGLTGLSLKEIRPICETQASRHRQYRYFPKIGEEPYESFLAVPLARGRNRIGVLVVQSRKKNYFQEQDIQIFQAIASQLANTLETFKMLVGLRQAGASPILQNSQTIKFVKGRSSASGCVLAKIGFWRQTQDLNEYLKTLEVKNEKIEDLFRAIQRSQKQLQDAQRYIEDALSDAASLIFTAQMLILKDHDFVQLMQSLIDQGRDVGQAIVQAVHVYVKKFDAMTSDYLKEKKFDVMDVGLRLLRNLSDDQQGEDFFNNKIVIVKNLLPSDLLKLRAEGAVGVIVLSGGVTSHVSILARSLNLPMVICEESELLSLPDSTEILLDASHGNIYINPSEDVIVPFKSRLAHKESCIEEIESIQESTLTQDKQRVRLLANINLLSDLKTARDVKAEGIGLYRTEFPFIVRSSFPSEEEQFVVYRKVCEGMEGKEITFRTLDIGGDKVLSYYDHDQEENPFLGMRSIRFSLRHQDIFCEQIRAILRAGVGQDLKIMFPMISSVDEFLESRDQVLLCIKQLNDREIPSHSKPKLGMMIELPSVAATIEDYVDVADFFSIGTNDFIQYMLAVDRTNEKVADLYLPYHPAVLRSIQHIASVVLSKNKDLSVCGQMAQDERYLEFFLGIGIRVFSLDPATMPKVQKIIREKSSQQVVEKAQQMLSRSTISELRKYMEANR